MENSMKRKKCSVRTSLSRLMLTTLFSLAAIVAFAQGKTLTGVVIDEMGDPVTGANVMVVGTTTGTITDINGNFTLSNVTDDAKIKVSYIGYITQEVAADGKNHLQIQLKEDTQALDEVVVVGYGVQRKNDVTGALVRVTEKELKAMPVKDALQAMQGKTAGLDITTNQRPGQTGEIRIRGIRSISADQGPLYVIDGMIIQAGDIGNINPSDIETIDILKDASATAIYGSRGANGVILISTKRGKSGVLSINYSGSATMENLYNVTENMSAAEWLDYARLAKYNMGTYASATPSYEADFATWGSVAASWNNIAKGWTNQNTVWDPSLVGGYDWEEHGKQTAISTEHTLSVAGGNEIAQGYGSFGYLDQEGTQHGQQYKRYTAKVSFDATPKTWAKFGTSLNASWNDQDYGYNFAKSVTGAGDFYGALRGMLAWTVPYDENGVYIRNPAAGDVNIINPINELDYTIHQRRTLLLNGSFYGQLDFGEMYAPLEGLRYRIQFGPEFKFYTTGTFYNQDGINGDGNNTAEYKNEQTRAWTLDNLIYYDRDFGTDHRIGLTFMQSASEYHFERGNMRATDVATADELWYNLYSGGSLSSFGTGLTEKTMASYMIRGNYSFRDRYLLTTSIRWDGASQLAEGNKWASFPSMALGWRIREEDFMQSADFLTNLKLRLGYGITGNAAISAYATKGAITQLYYNWGASSSSPGYVASDPSQQSPAKMANLGLGWEKTEQYNIGLDYGFFKNRMNGSIDLYKTKTNDLLLSMSIPSLTGYTSTYANVGKTKGWGIDFQINTQNIKTKDFEWTTNLTWSKDKNEIVELANGRTEDIGNRWFVGEEIGVYHDYVYDGIWKSAEAEEAAKYGRKPGQIKVKDLSGPDGVPDGEIDANYDRQIVGKVRPDWSGGITNTFRHRDLELSFFIYYRWGFTVPNGSLTLDGRYQMRKIDYWIKDIHENAQYYSPGSNGEAADTYSSSMGYQDGSFIKMRNISLGYYLPSKICNRLGINDLKIYGQLMNPFVIYSKCDYLDTDLSTYDNNATNVGSSITQKGVVFGLNISF
jgi:TonB-linked SusC/RagA family outer membrane protein